MSAERLLLHGSLEQWDWWRRLHAWEWRGGPDVIIHADAAVPKAKGLEYVGAQWGCGAWVITRVGAEDKGWFYA